MDTKIIAYKDYVDEHSEDNTVHVTAEEKQKWNNAGSKMTETPVSDNAEYPLLLAAAGQTNETTAETTYFDSGITVNPSTNTINANATSCCGYKLEKVAAIPESPDANTIYIVVE